MKRDARFRSEIRFVGWDLSGAAFRLQRAPLRMDGSARKALFLLIGATRGMHLAKRVPLLRPLDLAPSVRPTKSKEHASHLLERARRASDPVYA